MEKKSDEKFPLDKTADILSWCRKFCHQKVLSAKIMSDKLKKSFKFGGKF